MVENGLGVTSEIMRETLLVCLTLTCKPKALNLGQIQTPVRQLNLWAVAGLEWMILCDLHRKMPSERVIKSWEQRGIEWCEVLGGGSGLLPKNEALFSVRVCVCVCAQALAVALWFTVIIYSTQTLKWARQADGFLKQSNSQNFQVYDQIWKNKSAKIRLSCCVSCFLVLSSLLSTHIHNTSLWDYCGDDSCWRSLYIPLSWKGSLSLTVDFSGPCLAYPFAMKNSLLLKEAKYFNVFKI